jgi:Holliday junction DNA helicase RuvB
MTTATVSPRHQAHRPDTWDDLIGNTAAKEVLLEAVDASAKTGEPVPHVLLYGPSGMGKTTLAQLMASSIGGVLIKTTGSTLETPVDLLRLAVDISMAAGRPETDDPENPVVVFIDEIHALGGSGKNRQSIDIESVYTMLEDRVLYHNLQGQPYQWNGQMLRPKSNFVPLPPFTLIGATTDPGLLPIAFLRRLLLQVELVRYEPSEIAEIIRRTADRHGWTMNDDAADLLSSYSRCTPGIAYQLLTQCHTRSIANDENEISVPVVEFVIKRLRLHPLGLTTNDIEILKTLRSRPKGVGAAELARAVGIAPTTFTALCEPQLRLLGFLRTMSRREITEAGVQYLDSIGI